MEKASTNELKIKQLASQEINRKLASHFFAVADSGFTGGSPWNAENLYQSLLSDRTTVFYAQLEEEVAGFIVAAETPYILDIYMVVVDEPFKNRKIGRALFQALIQYAKEKKIPQMILETRKSNHPAIALYERVGFEKVSERKAYYSSPIEDAVVMKRVVGEEN